MDMEAAQTKFSAIKMIRYDGLIQEMRTIPPATCLENEVLRCQAWGWCGEIYFRGCRTSGSTKTWGAQSRLQIGLVCPHRKRGREPFRQGHLGRQIQFRVLHRGLEARLSRLQAGVPQSRFPNRLCVPPLESWAGTTSAGSLREARFNFGFCIAGRRPG